MTDDAGPVPLLSRVRTRLSDIALSMDAFSTRTAHVGVRAVLWTLLYAVTLGTGVFVIRHLSWVATMDTNKVPAVDSYWMTAWVGAALLLLLFLHIAVRLVARARARRRGEPPPGGFALMDAVHRRLRPLLMLPLLPALTFANVERDSPKETFFLITLSVAVLGWGAYAWFRPSQGFEAAGSGEEGDAPPPLHPRRERFARIAVVVALVLLWVGFSGFFSWLSITNHHALNTRTIDLGYYDNIFYQSIHGHPLACSFIKAGYHGSAHFDPILVVLSPLYLLYPRAEMILVLQAVWVGAGVVPAYLIARDKLGSRPASLAFAAMYALYPGLQGATMYEFHSLTLLSPMMLWLLCCLERRWLRAYWILLLPTLMVREDVALMMCFVGAYAILSQRPGYVRLGWGTIFLALMYFALVKRFFMVSADVLNSGTNSYSFAYYYDDLIPNKNGVLGMLVTMTTNPVFVLKTMLSEVKILYLLTLFLPLLFLPFLARPGRLMLAYGLLFCLLASRAAVYSVHFQYSSVFIPFAFTLAPEGLRRVGEGTISRGFGLDAHRLRRALMLSAFCASLLVCWKFGGLLDNATFKGGFVRVTRQLTDKDRELYAWMREQVNKIPIKESVGLTNRTGAHASNRKDAFFYPEHNKVDWIFIDEAELKGADLDKHNKTVAPTGEYELVARKDKLVLFKHKPKK